MDTKTLRVKKSAFQPVASRAEEQERGGCCSILHLHTAETESRLNTLTRTHSHTLSRFLSSLSEHHSTTKVGVGVGGGGDIAGS